MAIKQSRGITIGKGTPQRLEGQNGDMTIRSSRRGLKLYVKESNKWHSLDLGIDLRQIASTVRRLEDEVKRLSTKTNNTPVVDKLLLRQSGGTAAVGIQNKSGKVAFRNSTDSADGVFKNPKFGGALDGSDNNPVIDTQTSNNIKLAYNNDSAAFVVRIVHSATDTHDNRLSFFQAALAKWSLGYNADSQTKFNISSGASLATPELTIVSDGKVGIETASPTTTLDVEGTVSYKHTAFTTAGPTDSIDVSDTTVLEVDTSSNNVTIGGFSGGVQGQVLYIVKTDTTNFIQLEHNESPPAGTHQKIFLTSGADERVVGYGGYTLYCNGSNWFSLSNPTGAADAG